MRSLIPAGVSAGALEWIFTPHVAKAWRYKPVVQVSQVGYATKQSKRIVIEQDRRDVEGSNITLVQVTAKGYRKVLEKPVQLWGNFLRYRYYTLDFSDVTKEGLYVAMYRGRKTHAFRIGKDVFSRHVWQPTLEYYLPVQMCHMRVVEKYRIWHDNCHEDDARMSPIEHIHQSDGVSGVMQQIEHGLLSVLGGHQSLGRLYRGIIVPSIDQYVMLGDAGSQTDGLVDAKPATLSDNLFHSTNGMDDRWVFTEDNPDRELDVVAGLAMAARVIKPYRPELAAYALLAAEEIYAKAKEREDHVHNRIFALSELSLSAARPEERCCKKY